MLCSALISPGQFCLSARLFKIKDWASRSGTRCAYWFIYCIELEDFLKCFVLKYNLPFSIDCNFFISHRALSWSQGENVVAPPTILTRFCGHLDCSGKLCDSAASPAHRKTKLVGFVLAS